MIFDLILSTLFSHLIMAYKESRGKPTFNKKAYNDHAAKSREIKKALTHRSNLKRSYLKLLKKEGYTTEDKDEKEEDEKEEYEDEREKDGSDNEDGDESDEKPKKSKRKQLTFAEKAKLVKQRKEEKRAQRLEQIQNKRKMLESRTKAREQKKESLTQKTRTGQPLMGPRINNLLEKIKSEGR